MDIRAYNIPYRADPGAIAWNPESETVGARINDIWEELAVHRPIWVSEERGFYLDGDYEPLFKELAVLTGGTGWEFDQQNMLDTVLEAEWSSEMTAPIELMDLQVQWLEEVGLKEVAKEWRRDLNRAEYHMERTERIEWPD